MEYIYAALLLHYAGKEINEENLKAVLQAVGINVDEAKIKSLVTALEGVDINQVIEEAKQMVSAPVAVSTQPAEEKKEEKKEEQKEEEKKEEEALGGLSALFGL